MNNIKIRGAIVSAVFVGFALIGQASAGDRCGGVLMANKTIGLKEHKALVQKLGFYAHDGGLVMNGESTCTSIRIECEKTTQICRTATAITQPALGRAQVLGVMMSDDYKVEQWTIDTISAVLHTPTGGTSYIHVAINDDVPDKVEIINISKSFVAKPGEWVTEVMTVENDPSLSKLMGGK